jgi:hypothetical protein
MDNFDDCVNETNSLAAIRNPPPPSGIHDACRHVIQHD